jgi:hypothetical protein
VQVPAILPAFLEVDEATFVDSAKATTAQWRVAASRLQQALLSDSDRRLALRPMCQMVGIADTLGIPDEATLLASVRARTAGNVVSLRKTSSASLTDRNEWRSDLSDAGPAAGMTEPSEEPCDIVSLLLSPLAAN